MTISGKNKREILAAFARLQVNAGTEISQERQAGIVETLRERYTDAQIVQALDTLRFSWKPTFGQGLATCDIVEVIEGRSDDKGRLLTYQQMLDEYAKENGGGAGRKTISDVYELVELDGGAKWRKR